jgi:NAD(P)H-hydrate epimerase
MQKVFNTTQIRNCDAFTILNEPISSIDLMERAAIAVCNFILKEIEQSNFVIFCGQGNNGGDGLAIARLLQQAKKNVVVYIIKVKENGSKDFETNLERLKSNSAIVFKEIKESSQFVAVSQNDCIIDALLGTGLKHSAEGLFKDAITFLNQQQCFKVAIDVPSGLCCDETLPEMSVAVHADVTLSFQFIKLAFLFPENYLYTGKVKVLDIGLHPNFIATEKTNNYLIDNHAVASILPVRKQFAHKGNFGHSLLLAGARGKQGAALLASKACLRSGAGLLTLHSIPALEQVLNNFLPSAMFDADIHEKFIAEIPELSKYSAVAMGCGIGQAVETMAALKLLIQQCKVPLILDADALNILSENKTWLSFLPFGTILTPHPKEFERLFGKWNNSFERLQMQKDFSVKYNCYIVFKGAFTCISTPQGNSFFNSTGNPGMAKGGSGDVLTGVILGLLTQGLQPLEACIAGVYLHGSAGDLAKEFFGTISMLPEDLIEKLTEAFKELQAN